MVDAVESRDGAACMVVVSDDTNKYENPSLILK
jgi:hypothetical protein